MTQDEKCKQIKGMRQLDTTYHSGMAGYLMDFGFGGFIGYGKDVPVVYPLVSGCKTKGQTTDSNT